MGRRTKIVATVGPACRDPSVLRRVIEAGADVVRLNLSHGTLEDHRAVLETLLALEQDPGLTPAVMMDTGGPEVRVEGLGDDGLVLAAGQEVWVGSGPKSAFQLSEPGFLREGRPGTAVLLADGEIRLRLLEGGDPARLQVEVGGLLENHKKVACPDLRLDLPLLSDADLAALDLGCRLRLDWVAASFIRDPADVFAVKQALEAMGADVPVMAKIERRMALDNLADIVRVADGIMVARGDLGVEVAAEQLPWWQKRIIREANAAGKPVVTATEMLESMVTHGRPTRAEVTDVANAIWDGTDAVMLSAETAAGRYPVEAVETMARIAAAADARGGPGAREAAAERLSVTAAVSHATVTAAADLEAAAIVAATESGHTALAVARLRPTVPVVAVTPQPSVARRLKVVWGVESYVMPPAQGTDQLMERAVEVAVEAGRIRPGDLVVVIAGVPAGQPGTTNLMRVVTVGEAILRGQGLGLEQAATAPVLVVEDVRAVSPRQVAGKILVARATNRDWVPLIEQAAGLVVEEGGLTSHAAVVGLSLGKPTIVGATDATRRLSSGQMVTVDARRGLVYQGAARV
jgi:pyruvate kinase